MSRLNTHHLVDDEGLARLCSPRHTAVLAEVAGHDDRTFELAEGPFDHYRRSLEITSDDGRHQVTERIDYRLATPVWRRLLGLPVRRHLRRADMSSAVPWWAPPDRFDAATARAVSLLCLGAIVTGYLGSLIGQTATFATEEFGVDDGVQGRLLAAVRVGTLITLVVATLADRSGRRRWLLVSMTIGCLATVAGSLSTGPWSFGITQSVARGFATSITLLVGIMGVEVSPKNSRAYVISVLTLCAGLGSGMSVWFLPLADLGPAWWRFLYVVPIVGLPLIWWMKRHLRETERFDALAARTDVDLSEGMTRSRLMLIAGVAFLLVLFATPASQFRNDFLRDERGFNATEVSIYVIATNTPLGIGVALAGKLADRRGRRPVAAFGVGFGAVLTLVAYSVSGAAMWIASVLAAVIGAMAGPTLGVYQAEMFGTGRRGRANGIITIIALTGGALGLLVVGELSDRFDGYGPALACLVAAPIVVVAIVLTRYPETAHRELEEINPVDAPVRR